MRTLIAIAAASAVAGCVTAEPTAGVSLTADSSEPAPANYRQLARDYVRANFKDPYSIRDAEIAAPTMSLGPSLLGDGSFATPWVVCVRANAKNSYGAYTGVREMAIQFHGGRAVGSWDQMTSVICSGAQYQPFPEIVGA